MFLKKINLSVRIFILCTLLVHHIFILHNTRLSFAYFTLNVSFFVHQIKTVKLEIIIRSKTVHDIITICSLHLRSVMFNLGSTVTLVKLLGDIIARFVRQTFALTKISEGGERGRGGEAAGQARAGLVYVFPMSLV